MEQNSQAKIETLCKDEEYMKHLLSLGSAEEISKELEKEEVYFTADELRKIGELTKKKASGELSDEELEEVAGGICVVFAIVSMVAYAGFLTYLGLSCGKH